MASTGSCLRAVLPGRGTRLCRSGATDRLLDGVGSNKFIFCAFGSGRAKQSTTKYYLSCFDNLHRMISPLLFLHGRYYSLLQTMKHERDPRRKDNFISTSLRMQTNAVRILTRCCDCDVTVTVTQQKLSDSARAASSRRRDAFQAKSFFWLRHCDNFDPGLWKNNSTCLRHQRRFKVPLHRRICCCPIFRQAQS